MATIKSLRVGTFPTQEFLAGIPQVWLIDLNAETLEDHRKPVADASTQNHLATRGQSVSLEAFPEISFPVAAILG